ncbi:hypothetical protein K466DRAFT_600045 [Polyporus arcularius HHB13444]|uniref:DUF6533 domain-containing protein n=1 Tax=Polyporus arcularius HHB13444 TaxID=1314778 RepID=A0A5C3PBS7_9APHY|nr:hypothetical protein K466DRAFT_600045 [Polyporus arcularius HHB13444]
MESASEVQAAIIDNYATLFATNSAVFACFTLIFFEHILTFGDEVEMFWKQKFTGATVIFLLNRYLILVSYLMELATIWIEDDNVSTDLLFDFGIVIRTKDVFYFGLYIPWAAFSALRTYALTNRHWPLPVFVFLLSLVAYGTDMAQYAVGLTGYVDTAWGWGCVTAVPDLGETLSIQRMFVTLDLPTRGLTIAARTTLIASDTILIGVTWYSLRRRTQGISKSSLTSVMYRNGMLYFIVVFLLSSFRLILSMPLPFENPLNATGNISVFAQPLTVILVSHFLLDLQRANCRSVDVGMFLLSYSETDTQSESTVVFERRVVGSMGASLVMGSTDETEDSDYSH